MGEFALLQSQNWAVRESYYDDIQEAIVDQCAYLWCYQAVNFHVENVRMSGYSFNPMHDVYFYHRWKGEGTTPTTTPTTSTTTTTATTTTATDTSTIVTDTSTTSTSTTTDNTTGNELPFDFEILSYTITIGSMIVIIAIVILFFRNRSAIS